MTSEFEESEEYIELQRHKDFRRKKHASDCKCGYCVMKKAGREVL